MDIPLTSKEARDRGLGPTTSRLSVDFSSTVNPVACVCELIWQIRSQNVAVYVTPVNEFGAPPRVTGAADPEHSSIPRCIEVRSEPELRSIVEEWKAEMLIVSFEPSAKTTINDHRFREKWWKLSHRGSNPDLGSYLDSQELIALYSETLSALEFLGQNHAVLRCFDAVRSRHTLVHNEN